MDNRTAKIAVRRTPAEDNDRTAVGNPSTLRKYVTNTQTVGKHPATNVNSAASVVDDFHKLILESLNCTITVGISISARISQDLVDDPTNEGGGGLHRRGSCRRR